jgi:hypothetical protein
VPTECAVDLAVSNRWSRDYRGTQIISKEINGFDALLFFSYILVVKTDNLKLG